MTRARKPVDWRFVRRVLRARQDARRAEKLGFTLVSAFSGLPWCSPHLSHIVVDTMINRDGTALYVKLKPRNIYD